MIKVSSVHNPSNVFSDESERMDEKEKEEMLTTKQVMDELNIARATLYLWIKKGKVHPVKENPVLERGPLLFRRSEIDALKSKTND